MNHLNPKTKLEQVGIIKPTPHIKLVECRTCLNITRNENDSFESGRFIVYSHYHGSDYLITFDWCRSKGCIRKSKKVAREYKKFLDSTGLLTPLEEAKEIERKYKAKAGN